MYISSLHISNIPGTDAKYLLVRCSVCQRTVWLSDLSSQSSPSSSSSSSSPTSPTPIWTWRRTAMEMDWSRELYSNTIGFVYIKNIFLRDHVDDFDDDNDGIPDYQDDDDDGDGIQDYEVRGKWLILLKIFGKCAGPRLVQPWWSLRMLKYV